MRERAGRLLAAVTAALAFCAFVAWAPAAAADPVLSISAPGTLYVAEDGRGAAVPFEVRLGVDASVAHAVELVVDASALPGTVRAEDTGQCARAADVFTCSWPSVAGPTVVRPFLLTGSTGVRPGAAAPIALTARAADATDVSGWTDAVVGRPVLVERTHATVRSLAPGADVEVTPGVANHGDLVAGQGIGVRIAGTSGLRLAAAYSNCVYKREPSAAAYCVFDSPVAPAAAYEFSAPLRFTSASDLMYGQVSYDAWVTGGEDPWAEEDPAAFSVRGTGPALTLRPVTDSGFAPDGGWVDVRTTAGADYQALGGEVAGVPGETVPLAVGVRNGGPGEMAVEGGTGSFRVSPPPGAQLLPPTEGAGCARSGSSYVCPLPEVFPAGASHTVVFGIRITSRSGAPASASAGSGPGGVTVLGLESFPPRDGSPSNDTAPLTLRVLTTSPSPTPSPPASSPPPTTPPSGSMAPTGASRLLPWLIAASAAALGLGAVTVAMTRRPRSPH
ncbi:hypothetical protein SRB5_48340 [Streptomyces sp. RB5]|uniref:DUF11 domain-containing protein n=1 Tax=Streptomyces smaragdinus TaxID=2585196 RepID=A0A7K0CMF2_9ACTN|nr:hypothetical protein [Streptomyces smaragdinus]MQY14658.1 hypothetical protein [Streptomyces smaragdinus]